MSQLGGVLPGQEENTQSGQWYNAPLWALNKYGEGVDWSNDQVTLRNALMLNPVNRLLPQPDAPDWMDKVLDYSYKDLRDDASSGAGQLATRLTGSEAVGQGVELAGQILLPDAMDFATGGVGYIDNLAKIPKALGKVDTKVISKGGSKLLNAFKKGSDQGRVAFNNAREAIAERGRMVTSLAEGGPGASILKGAGTGGPQATDTAGIITKNIKETNVVPTENPFPNDKNLTGLYKKLTKGFKPKPDDKIYEGTNFLGDARKLREQGLSPTEVSKQLGVKVREVNGTTDVQRLRGSKSKGNPLNMKSGSEYEKTATAVRRRISELQQTPGKVTFNINKHLEKYYKTIHGTDKLAKHHSNGLKQLEFLYKDIHPADAKELTRYIFEDLEKPIGSILENLSLVADKAVHRPHHNWLRKDVIGLEATKEKANIMPDLLRVVNKQRKKAGLSIVDNLKDMDLDERKKAAELYLEHISPAAAEDLFRRNQENLFGEWPLKQE